jgi:hypothetical protein
VAAGYETFILDIPANQEELSHTSEVFKLFSDEENFDPEVALSAPNGAGSLMQQDLSIVCKRRSGACLAELLICEFAVWFLTRAPLLRKPA